MTSMGIDGDGDRYVPELNEKDFLGTFKPFARDLGFGATLRHCSIHPMRETSSSIIVHHIPLPLIVGWSFSQDQQLCGRIIAFCIICLP